MHLETLSEVGGVRTKWPQPGNRFVSFVRASGRAGDAREINCGYLEVFGRMIVTAAAAPSGRPLCFHFLEQKCKKTQ